MQLSKGPVAPPTLSPKAHNSVVQREARVTRQHRLLQRCLPVLQLIYLRAAMRPATSPTYSLLVVKTTVSLARDATKTTVETSDSEAADTRAGSAEVMRSRPGELLHRLWTTAETLVAAMTGEAATTAVAGTVDATDVPEEKMNTLDARSRMCRAHLAAVGQSKANLHLHLLRLARHLHQNGSAALRVVTTSPSTTDVAAAVVAAAAAAISEAQDARTTATVAAGLAAKTISCSRREQTVANAGTRMVLVGPRQETSTRRGDVVGGR